jgi:hypothetical protein
MHKLIKTLPSYIHCVLYIHQKTDTVKRFRAVFRGKNSVLKKSMTPPVTPSSGRGRRPIDVCAGTRKWAAKMVNDMAFEFRKEFPGILASHRYKIRDPGFIGKTIKADRAQPSRRMADIAASVGTWYGMGNESRGEVSKRFSGFEEEIIGSPSAIARPHRRVITDAGRKGRVWQGVSLPHARMSTYPPS